MKEKLPINIIKVDKTVKIPIYSSIKIEDGKVVGELEGYEEFPAELLPNDYKH